MTSAASTTMTLDRVTETHSGPFAEIRCVDCGRLLLKWLRKGETTLDLKCPRCGYTDIVSLST